MTADASWKLAESTAASLTPMSDDDIGATWYTRRARNDFPESAKFEIDDLNACTTLLLLTHIADGRYRSS